MRSSEGPEPAAGAALRPAATAGPSLACAILVLAGVAAPLYFLALGAPALSDPDEPFYAVPALEMLRTGSWATPVFRGAAWFDKPILFYWIVLAAYRLLGVSEAAARIGSALSALGGVGALFLLARALGLTRRASLASSLILATSLGYAIVARAAITDMTLTFTIILGMLAAAAYLGSGLSRHALLAGGAFGLAALTKGPVGLLVPGIALAAYGLLARRKDLLGPRGLLAALSGALLVAGPWYLYMGLRYPALVVETFFIRENLGRMLRPEHQQFAFYYLVVLAVGLLPWSGGLPAAVAAGARPSRIARERGSGSPPGLVFAACWFAAVLVLFSLAASKLPSYILPAYPPAALMLGAFWSGELGGARAPVARPARLSAALGTLLAAAAAAGLFLRAHRQGWTGLGAVALLAGALLLAGSVVMAAAVRRGSLPGLLAAGTATASVTLAVVLGMAMPRLEPFDSTRSLVRGLEARGAGGDTIAAYKVPDVSLEYYLGRTLARVDDARTLRRAVSARPGKIWVVRSKEVGWLEEESGLLAEEVLLGPNRSALRLSAPPPGAPGGPE